MLLTAVDWLINNLTLMIKTDNPPDNTNYYIDEVYLEPNFS